MDLTHLALIGAGLLVIGLPLLRTVLELVETDDVPGPVPTPDVPLESMAVDAQAAPTVSATELEYLKRHHPGDASEAIRARTEARELPDSIPVLWSPDEIDDDEKTEPSRPDAA